MPKTAKRANLALFQINENKRNQALDLYERISTKFNTFTLVVMSFTGGGRTHHISSSCR